MNWIRSRNRCAKPVSHTLAATPRTILLTPPSHAERPLGPEIGIPVAKPVVVVEEARLLEPRADRGAKAREAVTKASALTR